MKKVLIVDDNGTNRYMLESLLKGYDLDVTSAENGQDALDKARLSLPDLIVTDILMPVMDGYALCCQWKSDDQLKHIPLVFYTATYTEPKDEVFALSLGADRFILKPQEPDILMNILKEVLEENYEAKRLATKPLGEEMEFFRQRDEILFKKLEKKILDLEIANQKLKILEERYRLSFENVTDVIYIIGMDLHIISVSPSMERILGYKPQDFIGRSVSDLGYIFTPESFEQAVVDISLVLKGDTIPATVYRFIAKDGTIKYGEVSGSPVMGEGKIVGIFAVARDITERKRAEEAKRESEELFTQFMRYFPGSAYIKDSNRRIIQLTEKVGEYFGVKPDDWLGKTSEEIWPPELAAEVRRDDEAVLQGKAVQSIAERPQKDGLHTWITHRFPIHRQNNPPFIGCFSMDITEHKRVEEKLRESEEIYRTLFQKTSNPILVIDIDGNFIGGNNAALQFLECTEEQLTSKNVRDTLPPGEHAAGLLNKLKHLWESGGRIEREYLVNGKTKVLDLTITPCMWHGTRSVLGLGTDITNRKRAEEALESEHTLLRNLIDNVPDRIYAKDSESRFIICNEAMIRRMGKTSMTEIVGKSDFDLLPLEMAQRFHADEQAIIESGIPMINREEPLATEGGKITRWNLATKVPLLDKQGNRIGIVGVGREITDLKQGEQKLKDTLENLRKAVGTTIRVMASAVEMRDPYTAGHQIRSADLARAIATEMGLPQEKIDGIRMAGSIHDIGKLSIPAEILSKPTKLSEIEYSLIQEHSIIGYEILKDVESSWPLAEMVYQHHERMDGSGYPRRLKGEEILMEARIMAVADVVESMASHRPYRPALGINAALEEIEKNKETLYDADVVNACLRLFREKDFQFERA